MRALRLCVLLTLMTGVTWLPAQNTLNANLTSSVGVPPKAAKAPGPPANKKESENKYLVEVHVLKTPPITAPNGCYTNPLQFPASNADQVAKAVTEKGYTFDPLPPDRIAIYYKDAVVPPAVPPRLSAIKADMDKLALADFRHVESVPVARGSATKALSQLNLPPDGPIAASVIDESCILLLSKAETPDPIAIAALSRRLPGLYWRMETTQPTQRLFHLDASAVVKKLSGSDSSSDKPSSDTPTDAAGGKSAGGAPSKPAAASSSKSTPGSSPSSSVAQNIAVNVAAGGGSGESPSPDDKSDTPAAGKDTKSSGPAKSPADSKQDSAAKPLTVQPVNDTLVYSNQDGSDRGFLERNRLMAVLDLPRPEVLLNIWSLQVSTRDPKTASLEAESASELVSHNNEALENAIEQGWEFLSQKMAGGDEFFEPKFYDYVTQKFAESPEYSDKVDHNNPASDENQTETGKKADKIGKSNRKRWAWCEPDQYCLGFTHAFEPVRPTLTNLLLAVIAARHSQAIAESAIGMMECPAERFDAKNLTCSAKKQDPCKPDPRSPDPCPNNADNGAVGHFDKCIGKERKYLDTLQQQSAKSDCELRDRIDLMNQISSHQEEGLPLWCFKEQAQQSFGPDTGDEEKPTERYSDKYAATRVGLLRAAVADFLFNYKWASQYPHEFIPYDLTQSAQELNAEFNPLVLAFNRDVKALTQNLQTELQCKHDANSPSFNALAWFKKGDETFLNDGMISVRGISGVESIVDTVTQSYFDATKPPSLTDLVKSVSDAENKVPGVLKANLSADEAAVLLGALNSVQPAQAKIGRELKLDITPHALAGASSAELEVKLTADETSNPTLFKSDKQTEDTLSRVAKHDTNTRVRVESLKLFDVSAFSAVLQRPRSKFPIVPPLFEVPYFGSFVGWPLAGAKVYHRSTAIVSAIIVPTAADLAFGIDFGADRVCESTPDFQRPGQSLLNCHRAHSPADFGALPLRNFHKAMVQCFASRGDTFYPGKLRESSREKTEQSGNPCFNLSLVKTDIAVPPNE